MISNNSMHQLRLKVGNMDSNFGYQIGHVQ